MQIVIDSPFITGLIVGALSGIGYAVLGYLKSGEDFDEQKFVTTIVIGAVVGAVAAYYGLDYNTAYDWLLTVGAVAVVEILVKALWKRFVKSIAASIVPHIKMQ